MKLKSAFFVFVLLLLTVTVCSAQSPMGFSPNEFYGSFYAVNLMFDGPELSYDIGDEENGAMISDEDSNIILMSYSDNNVTELSAITVFEGVSEEALEGPLMRIATLFISLAYLSGEDVDDLDIEELSVIISSVMSETEQEYWGYKFSAKLFEVNNVVVVAISVTK